MNPDEKTIALLLQRALAAHAGSDALFRHLRRKDAEKRNTISRALGKEKENSAGELPKSGRNEARAQAQVEAR